MRRWWPRLSAEARIDEPFRVLAALPRVRPAVDPQTAERVVAAHALEAIAGVVRPGLRARQARARRRRDDAVIDARADRVRGVTEGRRMTGGVDRAGAKCLQGPVIGDRHPVAAGVGDRLQVRQPSCGEWVTGSGSLDHRAR